MKYFICSDWSFDYMFLRLCLESIGWSQANIMVVRRGKRQDSDAEWMFKETVYSHSKKQG